MKTTSVNTLKVLVITKCIFLTSSVVKSIKVYSGTPVRMLKKGPLINRFLFVLAVGCLFTAGFIALMSENEVHWETGSQHDLSGFNIFRSKGDSSTEEKLNVYMIAIQGSRNSGYSYQYIDRDIRFWKRYNYVIEAVKLDGTLEKVDQISVGPNIWVAGFFLMGIFSGVMLLMIIILRRKHEIYKNGGGL